MIQHALDEAEVATFARIADVLIPPIGDVPGAGAADADGRFLQRALEARPDLVEAVRWRLHAAGHNDPETEVERLRRNDEEGLGLLLLVAAAAHFMNPRVRTALGFPPGRRDPAPAPREAGWIESGLLEPVIRRGPQYRAPERARSVR